MVVRATSAILAHGRSRHESSERTRRQRLGELVSLLGIRHAERVQVLGAADLELDDLVGLLDLHRAGVLSARLLKEIADVGDLLRLHGEEQTHQQQ
jgi:hypothetical protein